MPLVNADLCRLTNPGSGALFVRCQVSGVSFRVKEGNAVYGVNDESFPQGRPNTTEYAS